MAFTPDESIPTTSDFPLETDEVFRLAEAFDTLPEARLLTALRALQFALETSESELVIPKDETTPEVSE